MFDAADRFQAFGTGSPTTAGNRDTCVPSLVGSIKRSYGAL